jgi:hypothetical protein
LHLMKKTVCVLISSCPSREILELARKALAGVERTKKEDVRQWARRLARQVCREKESC